MTNQASVISTSDPLGTEQLLEIEKPLDYGEEPTEADLEAGRDSLVTANFETNEKTRKDAIDAGALTADGADEFRVLAELPKASEIKKEYEKVTADIKNGDDDQEKLNALKQRRAELVIEYSYNTLALLWHYYTQQAIKLVELAKDDVSQVNKENKHEKENSVREKFTKLRTMATNLDVFKKNIDRVIPDSAQKYSTITGLCRIRNANLMTFLDRDNQLDNSDDQVVKELGRFADELGVTMSFEKIGRAEDSLIQQIEEKTGDQKVGGVGNPTPVNQTELEVGLKDSAKPGPDSDGSAIQELPYSE